MAHHCKLFMWNFGLFLSFNTVHTHASTLWSFPLHGCGLSQWNPGNGTCSIHASVFKFMWFLNTEACKSILGDPKNKMINIENVH